MQTFVEAYVHCTTPSSPVLKSVQRCVKFIAGRFVVQLSDVISVCHLMSCALAQCTEWNAGVAADPEPCHDAEHFELYATLCISREVFALLQCLQFSP